MNLKAWIPKPYDLNHSIIRRLVVIVIILVVALIIVSFLALNPKHDSAGLSICEVQVYPSLN